MIQICQQAKPIQQKCQAPVHPSQVKVKEAEGDRESKGGEEEDSAEEGDEEEE
jgi:hypothetical protein